MAELNLAPAQVIGAVQSENANIPAGFVDLGPRSFSLKTSGSYASLDQVRDTVIASHRRAHRAHARRGRGELEHVGLQLHRPLQGQARGVRHRQPEGRLQHPRRARARRWRRPSSSPPSLPKRIKLEVGFDQSENVRHRLNRLYVDFGIAIALVLLTLLPLGLRAAGIVMVSIPLSLSFGLACLYFLGYSLNQLSIAGFVVALGLLVDDSIVVVENIARHMRMGNSRVQAALAGTRQIFVAILGCTATLIFAFLPLARPARHRRQVHPRAADGGGHDHHRLAAAGAVHHSFPRQPRAQRREGRPGEPCSCKRVMGVIHNYYRPALHWCLARPEDHRVAAIGGSLLLSAVLVPVIGSSLFPKADTPQFLIQVESPNGTSLAETDRALRFVEDELRTCRRSRAGSPTSATAIRRSTTTTSSATTPPTTPKCSCSCTNTTPTRRRRSCRRCANGWSAIRARTYM